MAAPVNDEEKPLDPAVERVRRKLLRFVAINLGLLLAALMAVIGAIVYKWEPGEADEAAAFRYGDGVVQTGDIALPAGARVLSHGVSGNRLTLHVETGGGGAILVYDMAERRVVGRFGLTSE